VSPKNPSGLPRFLTWDCLLFIGCVIADLTSSTGCKIMMNALFVVIIMLALSEQLPFASIES
jgi:hypothetical protein